MGIMTTNLSYKNIVIKIRLMSAFAKLFFVLYKLEIAIHV